MSCQAMILKASTPSLAEHRPPPVGHQHLLQHHWTFPPHLWRNDNERRVSPRAASRRTQRRTEKLLSPFPHFVLVITDGDVLQCAIVELHCCAHGSVDATDVAAAAGLDSTGGDAPVRLLDTFRLLFQQLLQSKRKKERKKTPRNRPRGESAAAWQRVRQALLHRLRRRRETRRRRSGILCDYICHLEDLSPQSPWSILLLT